MIYLDLTSACHSPLNTGVKRMQRGLHALFAGRADYVPVCWQSAMGAYRTLGPDDLALLERPDDARRAAAYDSFLPGLWSDWRHLRRDAARALDFRGASSPRDILLVPDLLWDNRAGWFARARPGLRQVAYFHDAIALRRPRQSRIDRFFCARGVRALAQADHVLCISREAQADLRHFWGEFGCAQPPTCVLPWPVPFTGPRPAAADHFAAREILYVARLEAHKNHLRLLDACDLLWREGLNFRLRLIGCQAYPATARAILRRVRALQQEGRDVDWRSHVPEPELHAAYAAASFTAFPSLLEGFGLPIIESLWHGRPVVCGSNGALGEVAAGGGCELVETESVADIARGLRRLLVDETRYAQLVAETQARAFRDWSRYGRELDEALAMAT
jgi:glycosyltransferase involved in cell wall biosynthesis